MKKNIIYILLILAVLLLVGNILIKQLSKKEVPEKKTAPNVAAVDSIFVAALSEYNLDSSWIKKVHVESKEYDSLKYVYKIQLPADLPPVKILRDVHKEFIGKQIDFVSDEKVVNGYTTLNFLHKDHLMLQATLTVDDNLERRHSKLAIVISEFQNLSTEIQQKIFLSPVDYSVLLIPSGEAEKMVSTIKEYEKTYSILITDKIDVANYRLHPERSKTMLEESVRYIYWNFPEAQLYLIENESAIYNSASFNFVEDEFSKRSINLQALEHFIEIPNNSNEAVSRLNFYLESGIGKEGSVLIIHAEMYLELENILLKAKKRGAKFISPTEILNQQ